MKLIDKDALVAEIERLKECNRKICAGDFDFLKRTYPKHYYSTEIYNNILSFIDTLEVKEVGLEQRMKECPYRRVECTMYDGHILECKGACSWVVDYPKLKELKAQKGE